jgi:hypothetical protein
MLGRGLVAAGLALLSPMFPGAGSVQAETLDRVAVSVGHEVITESEVILDLRVAAFIDRKPVDLSGAAKRKSAERLVDQLLILREALDTHVTLPSTEATAGLVSPYAAEGDYHASLERYGISESDLGAHLLAGLRTSVFTDKRFRPDVQVSPEEIRSYYDKLVAEAGPAAAPVQTFEANREQIEKLLTEQRVDDALDEWLVTARKAANVRYRDKAFE